LRVSLANRGGELGLRVKETEGEYQGLGRNRDEITVKRAPLANPGEGAAGQFVRQCASGLVVTDPGGEIDRPALESGQGLLPGTVLGHCRE